MNGGGGMFNVPLEYYGLAGLGQGLGQAGQIGQNIIDTRRRRGQEDKIEQLKLIELLSKTAPGSEAHKAALRAFTGQDVDPLISVQDQRSQALAAAQARVATGQGTPEDQQLINLYMTENPLGMPAITQTAKNQLTRSGQDVVRGEQDIRGGEQGITLNEFKIKDAKRADETQEEYEARLRAAGQTRGGILASLDIDKVEASKVDLEGGRLRNNLTREQIATESVQRDYIRQNTARLKAEAEAAVAAGNTPFGKEDAKYLAGLAADLQEQGMVVPSVSYVALGVSGQLPGERTLPDGTKENQQAQFNAAYQQYVKNKSAMFQGELAEVAANNPNSPRGIAALNLKNYYDASEKGIRLEVSDEQLNQWAAQAMGGTIKEEPTLFGFGRKHVFEWTPPTPGSGALPGTEGGSNPDPTTVGRMLESVVQRHGSPERAAATIAAFQSSTPGVADALKAQFQAKYPNISLSGPRTESNKVTATNKKGQTVSFEAPARPEIPQGARIPEPDQKRIQSAYTQRDVLIARANQAVAAGREPPASIRQGIDRIDAYLKEYQDRHARDVAAQRELIAEMERVERQIDEASGARRKALEAQRTKIRTRLNALEGR